MKKALLIANCRLPIDFGHEPARFVPIQKSATAGRKLKINQKFASSPARISIANRQSPIGNGFTLVEILVVMALLILIVVALMAVFAGTQRAFRASLTQTDTLESGRMVMDMMRSDLEGMTPSYGNSNALLQSGNYYYANYNAPVNFYAAVPYGFLPLTQPLLGSSPPQTRTNVLEDFFILSHENQTWTGVGYVVDTGSTNYIYPLYRFSMSTNNALTSAKDIFNNYFMSSIANDSYTGSGWSHLMDGVVELRVRAYDTNGVWMTNGYSFGQTCPLKNTLFFSTLPPQYGEVGFYMFSNALPASIQVELGTLEDHVLQHAESLSTNSPAPPPNDQRTLYLQNSAGAVHLFRQRVWIRNLDISAYQ
jgi:type II secretory pathway pseudopilin PulG